MLQWHRLGARKAPSISNDTAPQRQCPFAMIPSRSVLFSARTVEHRQGKLARLCATSRYFGLLNAPDILRQEGPLGRVVYTSNDKGKR